MRRRYNNNGNGTFADVTTAAGINASTQTQSAVWGDYDGDGTADLYVQNQGSGVLSRLYNNDGDGTFTDVTVASGVDTTR